MEELEVSPLLQYELDRKKRREEEDPPPAGPPGTGVVALGELTTGIVSAWYTGKGLMGSDYGYIERHVVGGLSFMAGGKAVQQVEHYRFEAGQLAPGTRERLEQGWFRLPVTFRPAGRDSHGRLVAIEVAAKHEEAPRPAKPRRPSSAEPKAAAAAPAEPPKKRQKQEARPAAEPAEPVKGAGEQEAAKVADDLVRRALRKLAAPATRAEIVAKILKTRKLLTLAEQGLSEYVWEDYVGKRVKKVCKATGEFREGLTGAEGKLYCLEEEEAEEA